MNEEDKLIKEQFDKLPQSLRQAIEAVPWKELVQRIGKENNFNAEQLNSLEQETMFVIYAFESPQDYVLNLVREMEVAEDTALNIVEAINEKIFKVISTKVGESEKSASAPIPALAVGTPPPNLPVFEPDFARDTLMVKKNEVAYDAAPTAQSTEPLGKTAEPETKKEELKTPLPNYGYPPGKDPYREPLT